MEPTPISLMHVLEATVGGTRRHLLDLCLNLPRQRFRQHVVCSALRDERFLDDIDVLREAGIEVTVLPMQREIHPREDWRCLQQLRAVMRRWQPQIVHGHSARGGFLARMAARGLRPRPKTVYNPHGFPFQMRTSPLKLWLYVKLEQVAARSTDMLIATCQSQKRLAMQYRLLREDRIAVIPNGIRPDLFDVTVDRAAYRRELGLPAEARVIGTVAALTPQKGVEYLIRAAAAVRRERPEVHLLIAGDGPLRPELQRLARPLGALDGIHLLGQRDDIPQFLAALDLFVLPSLWEGSPYALLEAGAAGAPVIATAIPGNIDLVEHERTGLLVQPADHLDLTVTLFRALEDPRMPQMAARLRDLVRREYTLERMLEGHVRLYEALVAQA